MPGEITVLEKEELLFLLTCKGCACFAGPAAEKLQNKDARKVAEGLYRKGWLENEGSRFYVKRSLSALMGQLAAAKYVVFLTTPKRAVFPAYLYPGEKVLVLQKAAARRECIYLQTTERENLLSFLEEAGYLEQDLFGYRAMEQKVFSGKKQEKNRRLPDRAEVMLSMEKRDIKSGERLGAIRILRRGIYDFILWEDGERRTEFPYSPDGLKRQWEEEKWF